MPKLMAYVELTKPRALLMIIFTTALAYLIAVPTGLDGVILLHTSFGVALAGGGSLALNQYMERHLDAQMVRTRERPIPSGRVSPLAAFLYGFTIMMGGYLYLAWQVNLLCALATVACGVSYLLWYTPMKRRSSFSSFVGAIPGGLLPVMGWAAARDKLEIGAWVLFMILFLWQIPHALIISLRHKEDYEGVGMKQLPIISGLHTTNRQMLFNILVLFPVTLLPAFLNMTELLYPVIAVLLALVVFVFALKYSLRGSETDARRLFLSLTFYLPILLLAMYFDKPA